MKNKMNKAQPSSKEEGIKQMQVKKSTILIKPKGENTQV